MARDPHMHTQFNGAPPMGLDDPGRATDNFKGSLHIVGSSMQEDGASPYDLKPNNAAGHNATASTVWGINDFQNNFLGGDVI